MIQKSTRSKIMAIIHKDRIEKRESNTHKSQEVVDCNYFSILDYYSNKKYFQLNTGQGGAVTQNIRFDRDTAIFLIDILIK